MKKIRVLVADDHPVFQEGLCRLLEAENDIEVVAKAATSEETVRLAKDLMPDVAIIDVAMPSFNGIEAARQIKGACPTICILMLSAFGYESYLLASLRAGAAGYLLKTTPPRELVSAVRSVDTGEAVFNMKAISKTLRHLTAEESEQKKGAGELHHRELEVLKLAAKGMSNAKIATELCISDRTVQTHMFNIFGKLTVGSRTEAVLRALREGWLTLDDLP